MPSTRSKNHTKKDQKNEEKPEESDDDEGDDDYQPPEHEDEDAEEEADEEEEEPESGNEEDEGGEEEKRDPEKSAGNHLKKPETKACSQAEAAESERLDNLWASFLEGCGESPSKPSSDTSPTSSISPNAHKVPIEPDIQSKKETISDDALFKEPQQPVAQVRAAQSSSLMKTSDQPVPKRKSTGLADVAAALSKKPKASVLEKSNCDWTSFKDQTGIHEELATHNRGRGGYVDRMDFLSRADQRQFEAEKSARESVRNRRMQGK